MEHAEVLLVAGDGHRAAAPVELVEDADVLVAEEQRAESRGEPEHFVEGQRDEVGVHLREVQAVGRDEGRGVEQDEPLVALGVIGVWGKNVVEIAVLDLFDPAERIFDACEVVFGRVREEGVRVVVVFVAEHFLEVVFADLHAGFVMRHVFLVHHFEAAPEAEGVFADSQDGVVVLEFKKWLEWTYFGQIVEFAVLAPGEHFADRVQSTCRSARENHRVVRRRSVEELQHALTHLLHLRVTRNAGNIPNAPYSYWKDCGCGHFHTIR